MKPRDYQLECDQAVDDAWQEHQSVLAVLATGTGKTVIFSNVLHSRIQHGRAMVVAHREELLAQASDKIERIAGITPDIEMADSWADQPSMHSHRSPVVVASVQTLNSGMSGDGRMTRFDPNDFSTLIIDEAHHAPAATYRKVISYFTQNPRCKVLGVTATPDRADEKALGDIFTDCCYDYDVADAVGDGWLVPIRANQILVHDLDFSQVRTTAGELNGADLDAIMNDEDILHRIAGPTMEISDGRKTLVFATSCANAERLCEIFNRHRPDTARYVDGKTDKDIRRALLNDYQEGRFNILCNVGVATEGFDAPGIEVVVPRPTKSRALFAQMIGRGTRPVDGLVDQHATAQERIEAIRGSRKPHLEVIDFTGVAGRHKLMHTADILGGKFSDEITDRANAIISDHDSDMEVETAIQQAQREAEEAEIKEAVEERRRQQRSVRNGVKAKVRYSLERRDLFNALDITPQRMAGWDVGKELSDKQKAMLERQRINPDEMNYTEAKQVINRLFHIWTNKLCTPRMVNVLRRAGWYEDGLAKSEGSRRIDALKANGWRKPRELQHA